MKVITTARTLAGAALGLAAALLIAGCKPSAEADKLPAAPAKPAAKAPAPKVDPAAVVVDVNGAKMTEAEVDAKVTQKLARMQDRMPQDRLEQLRPRIRQQVVDEFVVQNLLTEEAKKRSLTVAEKDVAEVITKITSSLPPGVTLEMAMQAENMTEADLRREIELQLKVKQILESEIGTNGPSEQAIADFYEKEKERFSAPESVRARHILIASKDTDEEGVRKERKSKADALREQLVNGADFAALAATNSDCPSRKQGGDLGEFSRGQMVKPFEEAAFSLASNAISPVVETEFGYHIIQVQTRADARTIPLTEVHDSIKTFLRQRDEQTAFEPLVARLKKDAKITYAPGAAPTPMPTSPHGGMSMPPMAE